jgi:hypothetical protein
MADEQTGRAVLWVRPFDASLHRPRTKGAQGLCSWLCAEPAMFSVRVREVNGGETIFALCDHHRARVEEVYSAAPN